MNERVDENDVWGMKSSTPDLACSQRQVDFLLTSSTENCKSDFLHFWQNNWDSLHATAVTRGGGVQMPKKRVGTES